jgi:SAM-dependent methyltransferase
LIVTERILAGLARLLLRTNIAHSDSMKSAVLSEAGHLARRPLEVSRILEAATRYDIPFQNRTVLDLGCGDGVISQRYLELGPRAVIGVDIDVDAIARARTMANDSRLSFRTSSPESLPLEPGTVDTVISYDVFEHVADPPALLKDLRRVMRPSGVALIGTWGWRHPFAPHLWSVMPVPWAHLVVSERTLLRSCQRVYKSDWYVPTRYDFDDQGRRLPDKFAGNSLNRSYLNQYLIADFERAFASAGFRYESHLIPFRSMWAAWSRPLGSVPWLRELVTGYVWFVLRP